MTTTTRNFEAEAQVLKLYNFWMNDPLLARFYDHSDFCNYGYAAVETKVQRDASAALVHKLLDFIPEKNGTILDVACGLGATTRELLQFYKPEDITGINIADDQLARAAANVPGARFLNMDAAHLEFEDNSFDNVICVEAAFHFQTREAFMREALRVLKPGGRLVIADILGWQTKPTRANKIKNPTAYSSLLASCGYENRQVIDTTKECIRAYSKRITAWPGEERRAGRLGFGPFARMWLGAHGYALFMRFGHSHYVLASGQKPV